MCSAIVLAIVAGAPHVKVDFRPVKPVTALPLDHCEVDVTFKLTVFDGGREDYYCPRVVNDEFMRRFVDGTLPRSAQQGIQVHEPTFARVDASFQGTSEPPVLKMVAASIRPGGAAK